MASCGHKEVANHGMTQGRRRRLKDDAMEVSQESVSNFPGPKVAKPPGKNQPTLYHVLFGYLSSIIAIHLRYLMI